MIGQLIDARSPISVTAIVFVLIAVLLTIWTIAEGNAHPLIFGILPLTIGAALWLGRPRRTLVMIEHDGLMHLDASVKVPYEQITAITVGGAQLSHAAQLPAIPLEIHCDDNCLVLPAKMNVSPVDLHHFLLSRMPARATKSVHPLLSDYLAEQWARFGQEKVHVIHTREVVPVAWRRRRNRWVCGAILITGLLWIASAIAIGPFVENGDEFIGWIVFGCLAILGSFLAYFALRSDRGTRINAQVGRFPNSCLIVGPAGLAMVQGDMQGAIRWSEITKVKSRIPQSFRLSRAYGLQIVVRGGEINVLDIYERSPAELERLIRGNLDQPLT
jgi:hypothetical protein